MTVSTIAATATGTTQRVVGKDNNKLATSIKSLLVASGVTGANNAESGLSKAISLQTQVTGLRSASVNIAQSASQVEVAAKAGGEVGKILGRLQEIANQSANAEITDATRKELSAEFKALVSAIDAAVENAKFAGKYVLDGSLSADALGVENGGTIPSFSSESLLGSGEISVGTSESAQRALETLTAALETFEQGAATINNIAEALDIAASTVESALQNQDAARSTLNAADISTILPDNPEDQVKYQPSLSLLAQTNRLPNNILQLLSE